MQYYYTVKKIAILFLLCFVSIAVHGQTKSAGPFVGEFKQYSMDLRHINLSDFEGILPTPITRGEGTNKRWIDRVGNMPDYLTDFYQLYGEKVKEILNGGANWLSDPTMGEFNSQSGAYNVTIKDISGSKDFTFPVESSNDVIAQKAAEAVQAVCGQIANESNTFLSYLSLCFNYDFPEAFWIGNSASWGNGWSYSYSWNPTTGTGTVEYQMQIVFTLQTNTFDYRIEGFRTQQLVSDAVTEFNAKVKSVTDPFVGKSRYEQVAGLNDWLTMHNCYNSDLLQTGTANDIAWSPLSALRESVGALGPVCEGYARAFKVLCDKLSIPCILANGDAKGSQSAKGEAHMWNETQMENNQWYAVDVTWNDPVNGVVDQKVSGFENQNWLLLGKNDEVAPGFTFAESHPNTPGGNSPLVDQWQFVFTSLITDTHYEPSGNNQGSPATGTTSADAVEIDGIYYNLNAEDQTAEVISNPNHYSGNIVLPETVSNFGVSYKVTSIGENAFSLNSDLTSITIPNSVISIGDWAFFGCNLTSVTVCCSPTFVGQNIFGYLNLNEVTFDCETVTPLFMGCSIKNVTMTEKVTSIGESAFCGCRGFTSITIPSKVSSIGSQAFSDCDLTSLFIPSKVSSIGSQAFLSNKLLSIIVDNDNTVYDSRDNCNAIIETTTNKLMIGCNASTIPESVTSIDDYAFWGCSGFTSLSIPSKVTYIGIHAFYACSNLISLTIGSSVSEIHLDAFSNCNNLTTVTVLSPTVIGYDPFHNCEKLKEVTFDCETVTSLFKGCTSIEKVTMTDNVKSIGDNAFVGCSSLNSITIPNSVTSIGQNAFAHCTSLTSIIIPSKVLSIDDFAFSGCSGLTSVKVYCSPTTVGVSLFGSNDSPDLKEVSFDCETVTSIFSGCISIEKVTMTDKVTNIGNRAFSDCSGLTSITIPNSVKIIGDFAFSSCSGLTSVNIPNNVTSIGEGAFYACAALTSLTLGSSVTSIGIHAFYGCSSLTSMEVHCSPTSIGPWLFESSNPKEVTFDCETVTSIFSECTSIEKVTMTDNVTSIGASAFFYCSGLTSVIIGNNVTSIGDYSFSSCSGLTSIIIPNSVTSIGASAFYSCSGLTSITIPNSVTSIGDDAFKDCSGLISVNVLCCPTFEGFTFPQCSNLKEVTFDCETVTSIFRGCTSIEKVTMTDNVKSIGNSAFSGCSGLTSITIPSNVTSIGASAFFSCSGLTSITIPNSVTSIGASVFNKCSSLTSITIPSSVTAIGYAAFAGCSNLTSMEVHCSPTSIGSLLFESSNPKEVMFDCETVTSIFSGCTSIEKVTMTDNVKSIGDNAFSGCSGLTSITIPNSVTSIGASVFNKCSSLTSITIPSSVTAIGYAAFAGCSNLTSMEVHCSPTSIGSLLFESSNPKEVTFDCETVTPIFSGCTSIEKVTMTDNVKSIGDNAFVGCSSLNSITIPNSVTSIGQDAFAHCTSLTSITIPDGVKTIESYAFYDCGVTSIVIPKGVLFVDGTILGNCSKLTSIIVEADNPKYDSRDNCNAIIETATNTLVAGCVTTVIPSSVSRIGKNSFDQRYFETFTIPGTVKNIDESAFFNCIYLKSVTISEGVETIGPSAFSLCYDLESVELPSTLKSIGIFAFQSCREMKKVISHMEDPFALTEDIFGVIEWSGNTGEWVSYLPNITLYVPAGTKDKYAALAGWKDFKEIVEMAETTAITIGKSGKASYCGDKSLDFSFSDEVKAYIATGFDKDEEIIWLTRVKDVPAGVPVLIKGEANQTYQVPVTESQNSYYENMFKGNTSGETVQVNETDGNMVNYYLSGDGTFKSVKGYANIGNNKSYLQLPGTLAPAEAGATQTVKVGSAGKASYAAPVDLDFTNVDGLKAFTATGYDKSSKTIWLTRVMKVQKGEGVLLKGDAKDYEIPSAAVQSSYMNMFVGNTSGASVQVQEKSEDGNQTNFYLKGDGTFVSVNGYVNIGNNKCYLELPTDMLAGAASTRGAEAKYILEEPEIIKLPISFRSLDNDGNGTTAIRETKQSREDGAYYTLQGQRVVNPGKGLYIKNGKKVIIK